MKKYEIVLTDYGKGIYKGGNIEVMKPNLKTFYAEDDKQALRIFNAFINSIGTSQEGYYDIQEVKEVKK